jgi:hypothetical protein
MPLSTPPHPPPARLEAYFDRPSHRAGTAPVLHVRGRARTLEILRVGGRQSLGGYDARLHAQIVASGPVRRRVRLGRDWPSGVYLVRVRGGGRTAYAPLVLRGPHRLRRVAVVVPTNTWQAYNFRDADGDGVGDTWYAGHGQHSVDLTRPFARPGLPLYFRFTAIPFLRWLGRHDMEPAFLSDDDLSARALRPYRLLVFAGHEEYVTAAVYDAVLRFRGNVMFLSANNFFAHVRREGERLVRVGRWRDEGRPESAWIGVQYADWWRRRWPDAPYVARRAPWLYRGTGIRPGDAFGSYGKEVDQRTPFTPPGTRVLAAARDIFGPGVSAQMTLHRNPRGGRIFAAGALDFVNHALGAVESRLLENLFKRLGP